MEVVEELEVEQMVLRSSVAKTTYMAVGISLPIVLLLLIFALSFLCKYRTEKSKKKEALESAKKLAIWTRKVRKINMRIKVLELTCSCIASNIE